MLSIVLLLLACSSAALPLKPPLVMPGSTSNPISLTMEATAFAGSGSPLFSLGNVRVEQDPDIVWVLESWSCASTPVCVLLLSTPTIEDNHNAYIGLHYISVDATSIATAEVTTYHLWVEISCSNGVFGDGEERWTSEGCVSGPNPCDDGLGCTTDVALESSGGRCSWTTDTSNGKDKKCAGCQSSCKPICKVKGKQLACGSDGCGGSCGSCSSETPFCVDGGCVAISSPGSCRNPLPLVSEPDQIPVFGQQYTVQGDLARGVDAYTTTCILGGGPGGRELLFSFNLSQTTGFDIRTHSMDGLLKSLDTVLEIYRVDSSTGLCSPIIGPIAYCNDDALSQDTWLSEVTNKLPAGSYVVMVDPWDGVDEGPFVLTAVFFDDCIPNCQATAPLRRCGPNGCPNGSCFMDPGISGVPVWGLCDPATQICSPSEGVCVANPPPDCIPDCKNRVCGSDGCSANLDACGSCSEGMVCDGERGRCKRSSECNHLVPVCKKCPAHSYCGSDCLCHKVSQPLPDLLCNQTHIANTLSIAKRTFPTEAHCAYQEGCLGGIGARRLLLFAVETLNLGLVDFTAPASAKNPDLFEWHPCHGKNWATPFFFFFIFVFLTGPFT